MGVQVLVVAFFFGAFFSYADVHLFLQLAAQGMNAMRAMKIMTARGLAVETCVIVFHLTNLMR